MDRLYSDIILDSASGNGTKKGTKYDRASRRDFFPACSNLVPKRKGEGKGSWSVKIYRFVKQGLHTTFPATSKEQYENGITLASKRKSKAIEEPKVGLLHPSVSSLTVSLQPKRDKLAGLTRKAKRRKLALEADKELGQTGAVNAAIRSAKKAARPAKIGIPVHRSVSTSKRSKGKKGTSKAGAFDRDLSSKVARSEGVRAKRGDAIGRMGKHKGEKRRGK